MLKHFWDAQAPDPDIGWISLGRPEVAMLELVIERRRHDLGGFEVGRVLPFAKRRMVGPFVFFGSRRAV